MNTGKLQFTSEDESALIQAVKFGPEEKIREVTARIIGRMSDAKVHARTIPDLHPERRKLPGPADPAV